MGHVTQPTVSQKDNIG